MDAGIVFWVMLVAFSIVTGVTIAVVKKHNCRTHGTLKSDCGKHKVTKRPFVEDINYSHSCDRMFVSTPLLEPFEYWVFLNNVKPIDVVTLIRIGTLRYNEKEQLVFCKRSKELNDVLYNIFQERECIAKLAEKQLAEIK